MFRKYFFKQHMSYDTLLLNFNYINIHFVIFNKKIKWSLKFNYFSELLYYKEVKFAYADVSKCSELEKVTD